MHLEHQVHRPAQVGGAAVDTPLVGVVDDEHGGAHLVRQRPQGAQDGGQVEDRVLIRAGDDPHEGVDDDEGSAGLVRLFTDGMEIILVAQVDAAERGQLEGEFSGGLVAAHDTGEAVEEAGLPTLLVDPQHVGAGGLALEPGLAEGEADGHVEGGEGLFGAGFTDEQAQAGLGDEIVDEPIAPDTGMEGGRGGDEAYFFGWGCWGTGREEGVFDHQGETDAVGVVGDGAQEGGPTAVGAPAGALDGVGYAVPGRG
ncbi:MAG: hypothetical protein AMK69_19490 [Nitrospira bacterium SG8_3]|nr:MAG: hypothetical protein AMK69_19490 [Nitrospira bacterium SG8_3]